MFLYLFIFLPCFLASAVNPLLANLGGCSVLILDEASQMTETLSLIPLACARPVKMILVGDPQVSPPPPSSSLSLLPLSLLPLPPLSSLPLSLPPSFPLSLFPSSLPPFFPPSLPPLPPPPLAILPSF